MDLTCKPIRNEIKNNNLQFVDMVDVLPRALTSKYLSTKIVLFLSLHWPVNIAHCLYRDLNDKRPGACSDNNFIFRKINKI